MHYNYNLSLEDLKPNALDKSAEERLREFERSMRGNEGFFVTRVSATRLFNYAARGITSLMHLFPLSMHYREGFLSSYAEDANTHNAVNTVWRLFEWHVLAMAKDYIVNWSIDDISPAFEKVLDEEIKQDKYYNGKDIKDFLSISQAARAVDRFYLRSKGSNKVEKLLFLLEAVGFPVQEFKDRYEDYQKNGAES